MADRVVYDSGGLAAAIADINIDRIFFGGDIELMSGVVIPASKAQLIIDGTYMGETHTFTDYSSNLPTDTLRVELSSDIHITIQNMRIIGRNYYGVPCIYEGVNTSGVTVSYINVEYEGPQLIHNPHGLTHVEKCNITIIPSDASGSEEIGEVCRVEFADENTIIHTSETHSAFWFRGLYESTSFTLFENAKLTITTANFFMFSSVALTPYPVEFVIGTNASFSLTVRDRISYDILNYASSFTVGTGASFRYIQEFAGSTPSLYITGIFNVSAGASVYMQADFENAQPILHFPTGTGPMLQVSNPKSFVLYNKSNCVITKGGVYTRTFNIYTEQLNHWTNAEAFPEAGTFEDTTPNKWCNTDWAMFTVGGSITSTSTSSISSGLVQPQPQLSNFSFQTAQVISAGNIVIEPDPIVDNGRPITGLTEPFAKLIISFSAGGTDYLFENINADENGRFIVTPNISIPEGTQIKIKANTPFLIKEIEEPVVSAGEITIFYSPERITFKVPPVSLNPLLLRRSNYSDPVIIEDTRPYPTGWELFARTAGPLQAASGEVLENAVVFKDDNGTLWDIEGTPVFICSGTPLTGQTSIVWNVDDGILARITQSVRSGAEYETQLIWTLETQEDGG